MTLVSCFHSKKKKRPPSVLPGWLELLALRPQGGSRGTTRHGLLGGDLGEDGSGRALGGGLGGGRGIVILGKGTLGGGLHGRSKRSGRGGRGGS